MVLTRNVGNNYEKSECYIIYRSNNLGRDSSAGAIRKPLLGWGCFMSWKNKTLETLLSDLEEGLLYGWNGKTLEWQKSEVAILKGILTYLLDGKKFVWYHTEIHGWAALPPEVELVDWGTIYNSWGLGKPTYNCINIDDDLKLVAISLNGCSGASALTEYIKIIS